jgi:hypothetical protein
LDLPVWCSHSAWGLDPCVGFASEPGLLWLRLFLIFASQFMWIREFSSLHQIFGDFMDWQWMTPCTVPVYDCNGYDE